MIEQEILQVVRIEDAALRESARNAFHAAIKSYSDQVRGLTNEYVGLALAAAASGLLSVPILDNYRVDCALRDVVPVPVNTIVSETVGWPRIIPKGGRRVILDLSEVQNV